MRKVTKTVAMLFMALLTSSIIFVACNHEEDEYTNKSVLKKSNKDARLFEQNVPTLSDCKIKTKIVVYDKAY